MSVADDKKTLYMALAYTPIDFKDAVAFVNSLTPQALQERAYQVQLGNTEAATPQWVGPNSRPAISASGSLPSTQSGPASLPMQTGGNAVPPRPPSMLTPSQSSELQGWGWTPEQISTTSPDQYASEKQAADARSATPNSRGPSREDFIANRMGQANAPGGSLQLARTAEANAQWEYENYWQIKNADPNYDQLGTEGKRVNDNLNITRDNVRQQETARMGGGGPAGPSPSAIAHMQMETRNLEAQLTGLDPATGLPSYAAQQAELTRQQNQQTQTLNAASSMQSRQDMLDKIATDALERSKARIMSGAANYLPSTGSFAGAPGLGVAAPTAADMMAYTPPPPTLLPQYQAAVQQALAGLASAPQGGQ